MKDLEKKLRFLGYYQAFGALLGLICIVFSFQGSGNFYIALFISLLLVGFSFYCGYLLLSNKYEKGISYSIINQFLQMLQFAIPAFSYLYVSGLGINVLLDITDDVIVQFGFHISTFNFSPSSQTVIGFNIVAIILLVKLFNWQAKMESIKARQAKP